jgi:hypothetical protein
MTTPERVGLTWGRAVILAATLLLVASIMACGRRPASMPSLTGFEKAQGPVRIIRAGYYMDGGTCSAELLDASGQRFHIGIHARRPWPLHCFVGAEHPDRAGARMLPMWGTEERAIIAIANAAINATISPSQRIFLWTIPPARHRDEHVDRMGVDHGMGAFVRGVQRRMETLEALDHGELESLDATLAYFNAREPLTVERITAKSDASGFDVTVADGDGKSWQVSLPSPRYSDGSYSERLMLTLLSHALKNPATPADATRSSLALRIEQRTARILLDDRTR